MAINVGFTSLSCPVIPFSPWLIDDLDVEMPAVNMSQWTSKSRKPQQCGPEYAPLEPAIAGDMIRLVS
jgi:hypothetical protein